jgi:hypothetical protein
MKAIDHNVLSKWYIKTTVTASTSSCCVGIKRFNRLAEFYVKAKDAVNLSVASNG